jgi:hypothetical protein
MAGAKAATVEIAARSMLCVIAPPDLTGTGDAEREWFVREGPGVRRRLRPGDHVDPACELVALFGDHFAPSAELATAVIVSTPSAEVQAKRDAERLRLLPRYAEIRTVTCLNCGESSAPSPVIEPQVEALAVASELDAAETLADREAVQWRAVRQSNARADALAAADRIASEFKLSHRECDPARELTPAPTAPERDPTAPFSVWSGPVSFRG